MTSLKRQNTIKTMARHICMARKFLNIIKGERKRVVPTETLLNIYEYIRQGGAGNVYSGMVMISRKDTKSGMLEMMNIDDDVSARQSDFDYSASITYKGY